MNDKLKIHTIYLNTKKAKLAMNKIQKDLDLSLSWFVRHCIDLYLAGKLKIKDND